MQEVLLAVERVEAGNPLDRHNARNKGVLAAGNKAGLSTDGRPKVTTHDFRKTFISHLIVGLRAR